MSPERLVRQATFRLPMPKEYFISKKTLSKLFTNLARILGGGFDEYCLGRKALSGEKSAIDSICTAQQHSRCQALVQGNSLNTEAVMITNTTCNKNTTGKGQLLAAR